MVGALLPQLQLCMLLLGHLSAAERAPVPMVSALGLLLGS